MQDIQSLLELVIRNVKFCDCGGLDGWNLSRQLIVIDRVYLHCNISAEQAAAKQLCIYSRAGPLHAIIADAEV